MHEKREVFKKSLGTQDSCNWVLFLFLKPYIPNVTK
nr:MAG TPA: hypothetical protein [Caudoviricetes sp.]